MDPFAVFATAPAPSKETGLPIVAPYVCIFSDSVCAELKRIDGTDGTIMVNAPTAKFEASKNYNIRIEEAKPFT